MSEPSDKDIEIRREEVAATIAKVASIAATIRHGMTCLFGTISIGLICWTVVQITTQPPWLVLCLAIFGPSGLVAGLFAIWLGRAKGKVRDSQAELNNKISDIEEEGE